jgi:GNAT superfamily N-acetyltransferase
VNLSIEPATIADEAIIRSLQAEAISWLAKKGSDQWQPSSMRNPLRSAERGLVPSIERGEVYLVRDAGIGVVGTLTLDDYADQEFWTQDDKPESALYVHRMIVHRKSAGQDIGASMLDWAALRAAATGREWLRLDAWTTNQALHAYYERHGFARVRVVDLGHRGSGALFQRRTTAQGTR